MNKTKITWTKISKTIRTAPRAGSGGYGFSSRQSVTLNAEVDGLALSIRRVGGGKIWLYSGIGEDHRPVGNVARNGGFGFESEKAIKAYVALGAAIGATFAFQGN